MIKKLALIKNLPVIVILLTISCTLKAQLDSAKNLPNLLMPEFRRSLIKFKSGERKTAVINYNMVTEELVFLQDGKYLALDNPQLIDTVYMANKPFVPIGKALYEVVLKGPLSLFIQHKCNVEQVGSSIGYGQRSRSTGPVNLKTMYAGTGTYNLEIPKGYEVSEANEYWIRKEDGSMQNFTNKRQFLKLFPDRQKDIDQFISLNKINFEKPSDLIKLVNYCSDINK